MENHRLVDCPAQAVCIVVLENKAISSIVSDLQMGNGVMEATRVIDDRQTAIDGTYHLRQATRFE